MSQISPGVIFSVISSIYPSRVCSVYAGISGPSKPGIAIIHLSDDFLLLYKFALFPLETPKQKPQTYAPEFRALF